MSSSSPLSWASASTVSAVLVCSSAVMFISDEWVLFALGLSTLGFTYRQFTKKKENGGEGNTGKELAPACFDDPTLDDTPLFEPSKWKLFRNTDCDITWKEMDEPVSVITSEFNRDTNVIAADLVVRGALPKFHPVSSTADTSPAREAAKKGSEYYAHVAQGTGCVQNDYGGPLFLLPGTIIAAYVCGPEAREQILHRSNRKAMIAYILNHQQEDGGWGTHISGTSTNFGSVLNYTALRLLGVRATHPRCCKARMFLATREGALGAPLWAKIWLAILGCYDYRGVSPVPPEMWLLPEWFPFHPGNTWCHARMVALPMSFLYGQRFVYRQAETDATVIQLRTELYPTGLAYHLINWPSYGDHLGKGDLYGAVPSNLLVLGNFVLNLLLESSWLGRKDSMLRSAALKRAWKHIHDEDETNEYLCIGPVNKAYNMVCAAAQGDEKALKKHIETMKTYLWVGEDGMKMQGYINPMIWDSSFTLLALCSLNKQQNRPDSRQEKLVTFAHELNDFISRNQVDKDPRETQEYRDPSKGGWGFSTKENTYIVSDTTSEALRAVLAYTALTGEAPKADVPAAVEVILWMQNEDDGAWASYEKRRGYSWYELLNPAAVFGDIMIDYSYVECSSSCIQALVSFIKYAKDIPEQRQRVKKSQDSIRRATGYLFREQRADGSWFGQWGVCFTYATLFAIEALAACRGIDCVDDAKSKKSLQKANIFLLQKQNADGGWGESVDACALKIWVPDPKGSNIVNTAWGLMALVRIVKSGVLSAEEGEVAKSCSKRAAEYLIRNQDEKGDWPQQSSISGVFNKTCGITYTSYRNAFPIWALSEFASIEQ